MAKAKLEKYWTPAFRVSFPCLDEKKLGPDGTGEPKFSVRMIMPKDMTGKDAELFSKMRAGVKKAAVDFWGEDSIPKNVKKPIKDGNEPNNNGKTFDQEKDMWVASARTNQNIGVVNERNQPVTDPKAIRELLYPGCWARATVLIGAGAKAGNSWVNLMLCNIQKLRDDQPFGNRAKATDEFEPVVFDETTEDFKKEDSGDTW